MSEEHTAIEETNALNEALRATNEELQSRNKALAQKNAEAETLSHYLISIQDSVPIAMLVVGKQLQLLRYNNAAVKIFHIEKDHIGHSLANLPQNIIVDRILTPLKKTLNAEKPRRPYQGILNNEQRFYKISIDGMRCKEQEIHGAIITLLDISEQYLAEKRAKHCDQVYRSLIEKTDTGYVTLDLDCMVLDANPEYLRLSGHERFDEIRGRSALEWTYSDDVDLHRTELQRVLAHADMKNLQLRFIDSLGRVTPVESNATMLKTIKGQQIIIWCKDIKQRVEQKQRIEQLAYYDPLTGLENRVMLKQLLKLAIQRSDRLWVSTSPSTISAPDTQV